MLRLGQLRETRGKPRLYNNDFRWKAEENSRHRLAGRSPTRRPAAFPWLHPRRRWRTRLRCHTSGFSVVIRCSHRPGAVISANSEPRCLAAKRNNIVRDARDQRQERDSVRSRTRMHPDRHIHDHRDDHHRHQEAGSASRVIGQYFCTFAVSSGSPFSNANTLLLGAVDLVHPPDVFRETPHTNSRNIAIRTVPARRPG